MGKDDQRIRTGAERMGVTPEGSARLRLGTRRSHADPGERAMTGAERLGFVLQGGGASRGWVVAEAREKPCCTPPKL